MKLVDRAIAAVQAHLPAEDASAHCDIPCGIYEPHNLQIAAHTVIRMVQLLEGLPDQLDKATLNTAARHIAVKEEHAKIAEHEIIVLWTDYFKPEHLEKFPNLHDIVWKATKLTSTVKQQVSMQASQDLLASAQQIAEIFWATKGVQTRRVPSGQPSGGEIVQPVLG
ncbi:MAG: superoxide dismutase, Ni [Chloroflexota bacterium]|nr:superoxide dismutase, Ni [Chloroflexota bacterium]